VHIQSFSTKTTTRSPCIAIIAMTNGTLFVNYNYTKYYSIFKILKEVRVARAECFTRVASFILRQMTQINEHEDKNLNLKRHRGNR